MAQHGEEVVLARRLAQGAEEPGQRGVAIGGAARRASVRRRRVDVGHAHTVSLMPMRGGQRITVAALRRLQRELGEAVDRGVTREEALEDAGEQERARALERELVELEDDLDAGAERQRSLERQPPDDASHLEAVHALDLPRPAAVFGRRVQAEHRSQRGSGVLRRFADEREVVERQVVDEAPAELPDRAPGDRPGRAAQQVHSSHRPGRFEPPRRRALIGGRDRQQGRQVAVRRPRA